MPVPYRLIRRKNMHKGANPNDKLWYAQAKNNGQCSIDQLCEMIGARSTVSSADVKAVLDSLIYAMRMELREGRIVRLGDLGNFRLTFGSSGARWEDEFTSSMIRKPKITFAPGSMLRDLQQTVKFVKFTPEVIFHDEPCPLPHIE